MKKNKKDILSYVNPFWGNGATAAPLPEGMVCGWNWLKAQTGNTLPAAVRPFGWVSACPYSGAYPTGYGCIGNSCCGPAPVIYDRKTAWSISHFHMSGTGYVGFFYNYFHCTPFIESADTTRVSRLEQECATPGYYSADLRDYGVSIELTADKYAVAHRYHFSEESGHLHFDPVMAGLRCLPSQYYSEVPSETAIQWNEELQAWSGYAVLHDVKIYFALLASDVKSASISEANQLEVTFSDQMAEVFLGFSLTSETEAVLRAGETRQKGFDCLREEAAQQWRSELEKVIAECKDERLQGIFASAKYHSLVNPKDTGCEYTDFITLWDMYRTQLPMVLSFAEPAVAHRILETLLVKIEQEGRCPILCGMKKVDKSAEIQATALAVNVLADGFFRGIFAESEWPRLLKAFRSEFSCISLQGKSPTHILDASCAYLAAAFVAEAMNDGNSAAEFRQQAEIWRTAYDEETGYLTQKGEYYEGTYKNYSFRPHYQMKERIRLAGGVEKFTAMLDEFFAIDYRPEEYLYHRMREGYFEGEHNESDMEVPFTYIWCGRIDRVAEINQAARDYQFTDGEGGLPGNNDSGALSSWYVWSNLGLYPLNGTPYYLLGSPAVKEAELKFPSGTLTIKVECESELSIYPAGYIFNGRRFNEPWLAVRELEQGGELTFCLQDKPVPSPIPDWM